MIKVEDLLAEAGVFEKRRPALALAKRVVIVGDGDTLMCRKCRNLSFRGLVGFTGVAAGFSLQAGACKSRCFACRFIGCSRTRLPPVRPNHVSPSLKGRKQESARFGESGENRFAFSLSQ